MSKPLSLPRPLRVSDLSTDKPTPFEIRPDAAALADIARDLALDGLKKLSFKGSVKTIGKTDWQLDGTLGATMVQPCVVTLDPVSTRLDVPVSRLYVHDFEEPNGSEDEMPEDDSQEPLTTTIDPWKVMIEALTLHIPLYPRSTDAELGTLSVTEPGKKPMTDDDAKPFAGLAALKDSLSPKGS